jgi:transcription elongation factor GreA
VREVDTRTDVVGFGSRVEVRDGDSGKTTAYTLVSAPEAVPGEGRLSIDSPVGKALVGGRVGDVVTLQTPRGARSLEILAIGA